MYSTITNNLQVIPFRGSPAFANTSGSQILNTSYFAKSAGTSNLADLKILEDIRYNVLDDMFIAPVVSTQFVGPPGPAGPPGPPGEDGAPGRSGSDGASAYDIWLDEGHLGTENAFLNWLRGEPGSPIPIHVGNVTQGNPNVIATTNVDASGKPESVTLDFTLPKGEKGDDGKKGDDGRSAYESWIGNGNSGSEAEFIEAIRGQKGDPGPEGPAGSKGDKGESALTASVTYDILDYGIPPYVTDSWDSTKSEWLLVFGLPKGEKGDKGDAGDAGATGSSVYETWVKNQQAGVDTSEAAFLEAMRGNPGLQGPEGPAPVFEIKSLTFVDDEKDAKVTLTQPSISWLFDFILPKGKPGPRGPAFFSFKVGTEIVDTRPDKYQIELLSEYGITLTGSNANSTIKISGKELKDAIDKEVQDRKDGDTNLETKINTEITNRTNEDKAIYEYIDNQVTSAGLSGHKWLPAVNTYTQLPTPPDNLNNWLCRVIDDPDPAKNGVYQWIAASNSWTYFSKDSDWVDEVELAAYVGKANLTVSTTASAQSKGASVVVFGANEKTDKTLLLHDVARTGNYADLINTPPVPAAQVNADWAAVSGIAVILNKPTLFSGSYNDLTDKPTFTQLNADWNATSGVQQILNKPTLFSGNYDDLTNKPTIPPGFSGSWNDLTDKPTIPSAQVNSDWSAPMSSVAGILNKPTLFSGDYNDLINKPVIPPGFSGDYNDLINKPNIPAAQQPADWTAVAGVQRILNKPTLFDGDYNKLFNKPTIPAPYELPVATSSLLGGIKVGNNLTINNALLSVPNASETVRGVLMEPPKTMNAGLRTWVDNEFVWQESVCYSGQLNAYYTGWYWFPIVWQCNPYGNRFSPGTSIIIFSFRDGYGNVGHNMFSVSWSGGQNGNDLNLPNSIQVDVINESVQNTLNGATQWRVSYASTFSGNGSINGAGKPCILLECKINNPGGYTDRSMTVVGITRLQAHIHKLYINDVMQAFPYISTDRDSNPATQHLRSGFTVKAWGSLFKTPSGSLQQLNADWNATSGVQQILNKPTLFSGNYNDLSNKPTIPQPVPQVNADWNATSGVSAILNKPTLFSGDYNDLRNLPDLSNIGSSYTLPVATSTVLGGVKIGTNLSINNAVLSVPNASETVRGVLMEPNANYHAGQRTWEGNQYVWKESNTYSGVINPTNKGFHWIPLLWMTNPPYEIFSPGSVILNIQYRGGGGQVAHNTFAIAVAPGNKGQNLDNNYSVQVTVLSDSVPASLDGLSQYRVSLSNTFTGSGSIKATTNRWAVLVEAKLNNQSFTARVMSVVGAVGFGVHVHKLYVNDVYTVFPPIATNANSNPAKDHLRSGFVVKAWGSLLRKDHTITGQINSDWNATEGVAQILNKPNILGSGRLITNNTSSFNPDSGELFTNDINLHKVSKTGSYNDLSDKPVIPITPSIPVIGSLKTDNTLSFNPGSESFSNQISLHKVSKTGTYTDLIGHPRVVLQPNEPDATLYADGSIWIQKEV